MDFVKYKDEIVEICAFAFSIPLQLLSRQIFLISCVVFVVFFVANLLYIAACGKKIKELFNEPVLKSILSFLIGAAIVYGWTYGWDKYEQHIMYAEQSEMLEDYFGQRILCNVVIQQLEQQNIEPTYEWLDSMGVSNKNSVQDLICGVFYGEVRNGKCDYAKSRNHLQKAAPQNAFAKYLLGEIYYLGLGDFRDQEKGLELIEDAAKMQIIDAQYRLLGIDVLHHNSSDAEKWYHRMMHCGWREDSVVNIYLDNQNLLSGNIDEQFKKAMKREFTHVHTFFMDALSLVYAIQVKEKRPYTAVKVCDDYLSSSLFGSTDKQQLQQFTDRLKYNIYIETGNYSQAKAISKNNRLSFSWNFPFGSEAEVDAQIKLPEIRFYY